MFYYRMGLRRIPAGSTINERIAVRGVAFHEGQVLLVQTKGGAFKFPGGGMEGNESHSQTLERELMEETGYQLTMITKKAGVVIQQRVDLNDTGKYFKMKSFYYYCQIDTGTVGHQNLNATEQNMGMRPVFVSLQNALHNNEAFLSENKENTYEWVLRDTFVMRVLLRDLQLNNI